MFVVYFRSKGNGYFLYCDGDEVADEPACYGGTSNFAEATKFKTAKQARDLGNAYLKRCRADPESSECVVLKQA